VNDAGMLSGLEACAAAGPLAASHRTAAAAADPMTGTCIAPPRKPVFCLLPIG
jgi:hypothetical protein